MQAARGAAPGRLERGQAGPRRPARQLMHAVRPRASLGSVLTAPPRPPRELAAPPAAARHPAPALAAPRAAPHAPHPPRGVAAHYRVPAHVAAELRPDELAAALPLPRAVESAADDPLLHNPLERMARLGTNWFGLILDFEGVVVDSTLEVHKEAWRRVAAEARLAPPLGSALGRIKGLRDEVIVMQLFTWTRNPAAAAKLAGRKEEIYDEIMSGNAPAEAPGVRAFLETLHNSKIPVALASPLPERRLRASLERLGLGRAFAGVVAAEDNASPDLELSYLSASHHLARPPIRCVVVGDSNRSVEAAHELGMRSVVVTGGQAAWDFGGADLVVRNLGQLGFVNLKKLFGQEELVESATPWEEIRKEREADYEAELEALSAGGGFGFGFDAQEERLGSAGSLSSGASEGFAWPGPAGGREREPALAAGGGGGGAWRAASPTSTAVAEDEDDEGFDVVMPPPGSALWDLQR
ncbi:MAG: HAD-like domain-containing protein [Monoraphidium minutum]|nr:MAG: HAD-like domain-containing protein [Monoraphidium minutum]